ncbi:NAD(P)-binding protein [Terfezia boudieri ATCC MYA-4762]|uniref:NAD(P)-binding protein n=1 Tax=Terfezia boudieri ATCC MYA-4762 TaxID=1051890 RepID=A0A3N4LS77_9PEZI|nr:NAD(P)-binding protein [Terfezia boudieri ATCC MYA-4762]
MDETGVQDLTGKVAIVTGGNAGLGKNSVLEFARHGAKVYMASRTESRPVCYIYQYRTWPVVQANCYAISVKQLRRHQASFRRIHLERIPAHILLNNAGVMAMASELTKDGFDIQWGTNYIGHALLTKLPLPTLIQAAQNSPKNSILALATSSKLSRYAQSKLANVLHAKALAMRYSEDGITAVSCHRGVIFTDLKFIGGELQPDWAVYVTPSDNGDGGSYDIPLYPCV